VTGDSHSRDFATTTGAAAGTSATLATATAQKQLRLSKSHPGLSLASMQELQVLAVLVFIAELTFSNRSVTIHATVDSSIGLCKMIVLDDLQRATAVARRTGLTAVVLHLVSLLYHCTSL
jgi:hypothetical protein